MKSCRAALIFIIISLACLSGDALRCYKGTCLKSFPLTCYFTTTCEDKHQSCKTVTTGQSVTTSCSTQPPCSECEIDTTGILPGMLPTRTCYCGTDLCNRSSTPPTTAWSWAAILFIALCLHFAQ